MKVVAGLALAVGVLGALVFGAGLSGARSGALPRSTTDRADDIAGAQVHAVYVVPRDLADRSFDTDGTIAASVRNWQTWLRGQTGGRRLRLDTSRGELDVTFFRMPQTDAQIAARGAFVRDAVEAELKSAGATKPDKIYAVYYDGTSTFACGGGAWPPSLPGIVGAVYMRSTQPGFLCYDPPQSRAGITYMDYAVLHELLHTLGFVATCAPNHTRSGHTSDDRRDLMWAGDGDWLPSLLDVGRNDYFGHSKAGCPDLAKSLYLEGNSPPTSSKPVPKCKKGQKPTKKKPCRP